MKRLIVIVTLIACSLAAHAQENIYGRFDFEIGFQIPLAAAQHAGMTNAIVPAFYFEGRWQMEPMPIDLGFHVGLSVIQRKYENGHDNYRAVPILLTGDYQFGRGARVNPYVGLGIGVSANTIVNNFSDQKVDFAVSPRAGVRLFRFLNVAVGYLATQKDYSRLYCNVGFYYQVVG